MSQRYLNWGEFPVKQDQCDRNPHFLVASPTYSTATYWTSPGLSVVPLSNLGRGDFSTSISALESDCYIGASELWSMSGLKYLGKQ